MFNCFYFQRKIDAKTSVIFFFLIQHNLLLITVFPSLYLLPLSIVFHIVLKLKLKLQITASNTDSTHTHHKLGLFINQSLLFGRNQMPMFLLNLLCEIRHIHKHEV